jgi:hypothetical protein
MQRLAATVHLGGPVHQDRLFSSADPLRFVDPRYEPRDPIFDVEEPDLPPTVSRHRAQMVSRKQRRALLSRIASSDPLPRPME